MGRSTLITQIHERDQDRLEATARHEAKGGDGTARTVTMQLSDAQAERLARVAHAWHADPAQAGAWLLDEALRMSEFAFIEFRESTVGRQAYIQGSSLAVWEVVMLACERGGDPARTASYLGWPLPRVQAALNYAGAYPQEIEAALADNASYDAAMLPQTRIIDLALGVRI